MPELALRPVDVDAIFGRATVEAAAGYSRFFRVAWALATAAQLAALAALARRRPRVPAALAGALAYAAAWLARLPFELAGQWWRRRHGVSRQGYLDWVAGTWSTTLGELLLAALAAAALVALARRVRRWWLPAWGALVALAAAYVLAGPLLLAPRLEPLRDRALAAELRALGADEVLVRRARERTRAINAEAIGVGATTRVVIWDTALALPRRELRFLAAHEVAHVEKRHAWKGLGWFALLALPGALVLARVRPREGGDVPRAALVALVLSLLALPLANAVSRRYEREADWAALQATRDPAAAEALFRRFARVNLTDPDPPAPARALLGTHPTLAERVATGRAAALRAGPGSP